MYIVAIHVHVYGNEYVHVHDKVYYSVDLPYWSSSLSMSQLVSNIHVHMTCSYYTVLHWTIKWVVTGLKCCVIE